MDTLQNEKCVLIIGVSSLQGEVYISRIGQIIIIGTFKSVHFMEVSTFQECPQGWVPLYIMINSPVRLIIQLQCLLYSCKSTPEL